MYTHTKFTRAAMRGIAALACLSCVNAYAVKVKVTVENTGAPGGLWFTPTFFGFHDGTFDVFNAGDMASGSLETIAETGSAAGLVDDLTGPMGQVGAIANVLTTMSGPPPFAPGTTSSFMVDLDAVLNKYLNYASMIIPSNDAFIGNADAIDLFDMMGDFVNQDIMISGANIWDAGTELNDGNGAAFSTNMTPPSTDTMSSIALLGSGGLDNLVGHGLAAGGGTLGHAFVDSTPIARITIQQVPDTTAYIGWLGAVAVFGFRFISRKRMGAK